MEDFYCKYCGKTKKMRFLKGRKTCSKACLAKRQRELHDARPKKKKAKKADNGDGRQIHPKEKVEKPKKGAVKIGIVDILETAEQGNLYSTNLLVSDLVGIETVFLFGINYSILKEHSNSKRIVTKIEKRGILKSFLEITDYTVCIRDSQEFGRFTR